MFKNQYLIASKQAFITSEKFQSYPFKDWIIYYENTLPVIKIEGENKGIVLLGHIVNPDEPILLNEGIIQKLYTNCNDIGSLEKSIECMCGRFVLLCIFGEQCYVLGDASHTRQMLFSKHDSNKVITSSLKFYYYLYNKQLVVDENVLEISKHKNFTKSEHDFYGIHTIDARFKRLLPNHRLNLNSFQTSRINILNKFLSFNDTVDRSIELLEGTFNAMVRRFKMFQPITAGFDTRLLLGASFKHRDEIRYYIFSRPNNFNSHDITIPKEIAASLNINFKIYQTEALTKEFMNKFKEEHVIPRILPKTSDIQYHYYHTGSIPNAVNVSGCGGNILRMAYGKTKRDIKSKELPLLTTYNQTSEFISGELNNWYKNVFDYGNENNFSILDLFYLENRMGIWGALYPLEQDIAIDEIMPFNNKELIANGIRLHYEDKGFPTNRLTVEIIKRTRPELLNFPVNPNEPIKKIVGGYLNIKLTYKKFKNFLQ